MTAALLVIVALAAWAPPQDQPPCDIDLDEDVLILPASASPAPDGGWTARLEVWVFEPELDSLVRGRMLAELADALDLPPGSADDARFRERAAPFFADNERGQLLALCVGDVTCVLPETAADGCASATVHLPAEAGEAGAWLDVEAVLRPDDPRERRGALRLVPAEGLTVVADIDDTLKVTRVGDTEALLRQTFLLPFEAVPGMAPLLATWSEAGASFEYLSCSPRQLSPALLDFLRTAGLPQGGLHLRPFRWKDERLLSLFEEPARHKRPVLEQVLAAHPSRALLLLGDSGEDDPELYGDFARAHPEAQVSILVRASQGEAADDPRWPAAFRDLPRERWQVFSDPGEVDAARWLPAPALPPDADATR